MDLGVALSREAADLTSSDLSPVGNEFDDALASEPGWRAIARFVRAWGEPHSLLHAWVPFVFLEYDESSHARPTPSVFAALDSPIGEAGSRLSPELGAARQFAELLLGDEFDTRRSAALERGFCALRSHSRVLHVALMLGRNTAAIRLSVLAETELVSDYFSRLDAPDLAAQAEHLLSLLPERPSFSQLDFDIGPPTGARVGMGHRPANREAWGELLTHLVRLGAADPHKADAALRWLDASHSAGIRRELSHVKLATDGAGGVEAKIYLGLTRVAASGRVRD